MEWSFQDASRIFVFFVACVVASFPAGDITCDDSDGQGDPSSDTAQAIAVMLENHGIARGLKNFTAEAWRFPRMAG